MAEIEIKNHLQNSYKIIINKKYQITKKIKEVILEMLIIIFAVSISIWFHNWSEHRHQQKEVKKFLIGLKSDIQNDVNDGKYMLEYYHKLDTVYRLFSNLSRNKTYDKAKLKEYLLYIDTNYNVTPNNYRFNGFLSSGKIGNIENDSLSLNILKYYHDTIIGITLCDSSWISGQKNLYRYLDDKIENPEDIHQYWLVLSSPRGKKMTKHLIPWQHIYKQYHSFVDLGQTIIKQIDDEYDLEK